ncbi:hypothetical protein ACIGG6_03540 [Vreelandella lionensis]|uniref:Uncharacterized protein n=1 Tax=Vreelandella lionensis TaxID=1144478 RepID=A0ABW8BPD3_9GAMM
MNIYHSRCFQIITFITYNILAVLAYWGWLALGNEREKIVSSFNFIKDVDPSGFLIFAGIAAGITYKAKSLIYYRNFAFMFGFAFAIAQAITAAMTDMENNPETYNLEISLLAIIIVCGAGFIIFSVLAMLAHSKEMERPSLAVKGEPKTDDVVINLNINLDLSAKNDASQPSPVSSDPAPGPRYLRSLVRRFRVRR